MNFLVCGINHQTASLAVREKVSFSAETLFASLRQFIEKTHAKEALILSTCNRTEIYCAGTNPQSVIDWLHSYKQLTSGALDTYLYVHQNQDAVRHLFLVANGLDSMVLGESQITRQIKAAFRLAHSAGTIGNQFQHLFQYLFSVIKEVRTKTRIGTRSASLAVSAIKISKRIFSDLPERCILLIGSGQMIELVAKHLFSMGVNRFWIANRTLPRAEKLAKKIQGTALPLQAIPNYVALADVIIIATNHALPLLNRSMLETALKQRNDRPVLMLDLAVPRNIEPEIGQYSHVFLHTIDDLKNTEQVNSLYCESEINQAKAIIDGRTHQYILALKARTVAPLIQTYHQEATLLRDHALNKILQLLKNGMPAEEALARLARDLTNKLLHKPSVALRKAAYQEKAETLTLACQLLGLDSKI